jgi:hypothetical protein
VSTGLVVLPHAGLPLTPSARIGIRIRIRYAISTCSKLVYAAAGPGTKHRPLLSTRGALALTARATHMAGRLGDRAGYSIANRTKSRLAVTAINNAVARRAADFFSLLASSPA